MTGVAIEAQAALAVNLCKTYGAGHATVRALDNVTVAFERGRFTAVMGPSGSGKSTLMHCMAGLDRPTSGKAYVGGQDIGQLDDAGLTRLRRDRIGFVFQYFNLVPTLTAGENITLPTLTFEPRTAIVGLAVGTLVTVASAIGPARNALRIPPVAALTDRQEDGTGAGPTRRRLISGSALTVFGVLLLGIGLSRPVVALVGVGAACTFIGVAMLAPAIARPLASLLGRPLAQWLGTPGQLGRQNSMRSPRRTAQTASALMVGLALVLEVLGLVAAGTTNRETAARLFISEATVKTHLLHVYAKLGVTDRAAAVAEAFNRGLLTPGKTERH